MRLASILNEVLTRSFDSVIRMFWMMIVARGIAGFGAGGEYPVCATSATEAADETASLRKKRGFLVASTTDFAVDMVRTLMLLGLGPTSLNAFD